MSFPYHDPYWSETAKFLAQKVAGEHKVLAPDDFWQLFPRIYRYINTRLKPDINYDWAVIHKGQLGDLAPEFLRDLVTRMVPIFANEVFVVWSGARGVPALRLASKHVRPLIEAIKAAAKGPLGPTTQTEHDHVLPDPGSIFHFGLLTIGELREAMDAFWQNGGYPEDTFRDRSYSGEIDSYVTNFLGDVAGRTILDLCCGAGRLPLSVTNAGAVVGIDISKVALDRATAAYSDRPAFKFAVMDAHALGFAPASFDIVTFTEAIEHVHDAPRVIAEIKRVLKPGGYLLVTTANSNSLHLIMTRKLGYPSFKTSFQHVKEFSFDEVRTLLQDSGFTVTRSGGMFLFPYWGIPGVDQIVRPVTDSDPEMVELTRELGRKVGPGYAYSVVVLAQNGG
jgi:2-polyprenyl-3-methyl-5-hydroxy-6-metoxy-1,4-benzoquinol methylase